MEWTGKVVFGERWALEDASDAAEEAALQTEMQGLEWKSRKVPHFRLAAFCPSVSVSGVGTHPDLALRDIPEKNVQDDLSGKPLDGLLVTAAKHEELIEMYRRQVWVEKPTS